MNTTRKPVDALFDAVNWIVLPPLASDDDIPVATHEGTLDISGIKIKVYQLSNGQRVIDERSLAEVFPLLMNESQPQQKREE